MDAKTTTGKLGALMLCALAVSILTACGGGGGSSGGPATTTIWIDVAQDAHTDGTSLTIAGNPHYVGDDGGGNTYRGLLRFPLASIPGGSNIVGAYLHLSFLAKHGTPAGTSPDNLGQLEFRRILGTSTFNLGDYSAATLAHDPSNNLVADFPFLRPRIGLLTPVLSAFLSGDTHLKLRLQYTQATNTNGVTDRMEFAGLAHPTEMRAQLEVITQP